MASSSSENKIVLQTSDKQTFEVAEAIACMSKTMKNMMEDDCTSDNIPLPNVDSATLTKVIQFCRYHVEFEASAAAASGAVQNEFTSLKELDENFVKEVKDDDEKMMFSLILAANYLDIKELLDVMCQAVADEIKDMSLEQIREYFNIECDFTPEEEQKIRDENAWAFQ